MIAMSPCCNELYGSRRTTMASANDSPRRASSAARSSNCLFNATPRNADRALHGTRDAARVYRIVTTWVLEKHKQCVATWALGPAASAEWPVRRSVRIAAIAELGERRRRVDIDEDR